MVICMLMCSVCGRLSAIGAIFYISLYLRWIQSPTVSYGITQLYSWLNASSLLGSYSGVDERHNEMLRADGVIYGGGGFLPRNPLLINNDQPAGCPILHALETTDGNHINRMCVEMHMVTYVSFSILSRPS